MIYHLSEYLIQAHSWTFLRLGRYITVRTMLAMMTAFIITLLFGRLVINFLYRRKIRDVVRDYSVMSVESKKGTPTMGGVLMIGAIVVTVGLWGNFASPFVYYLLFAMVWFAALGGVDDYLKIRYQDSDKGLSRGSKYLAQSLYGLIFGLLFLHPATSPLPHPDRAPTCRITRSENCPKRCRTASDCQAAGCPSSRTTCRDGRCVTTPCQQANKKPIPCYEDLTCEQRCGKGAFCYKPWIVQLAANEKVTFSPSQLYIPFHKYPLFDLSWAYLLIIILMIIYSANAVNFADGLDGLAIVPTLFSYGVYGIYAYLFGHALLSRYLLFPTLPGVGELAVFCGAVVGAGLGFLWFNTYPAEIFMGDTGSITLGGVLGTLMILLKQEILFFLLGGIFTAEILSVMLQDWLGIQILGRRLLYRAPIHHTFQHRGLSEPKIAVRFWIVSGMLALLALAALKIR